MFDSQHSQKISEEQIIDVAEFNQWRWLEETGQWLENVDQIHPVLANGKPILQKLKFVSVWENDAQKQTNANGCLGLSQDMLQTD